MTKRDLLSLAAQIFGIAIVVHAIVEIPNAISMVTVALVRSGRFVPGGLSPSAYTFFSVSSLVMLPLIFGLILLSYSESLATALVRENADAPLPNLGASPRPWFSIAARVIGLLAIVHGLPDLIGGIIQAVAVTSVGTVGWEPVDKLVVFFRNVTASGADKAFYPALARIIVGALLIWGGERLSLWVFPKKRKSAAQVTEDASE